VAGTEEVIFAMKFGMKVAEALTIFAKHCALSIGPSVALLIE